MRRNIIWKTSVGEAICETRARVYG